MDYTVDDIQDMVDEIETARADFVTNAAAAEKMWLLKPFEDDAKVYANLDGAEAIATADPYNVMQLFLRFVAGEPRIEVPYLSAEKQDDERSQKLESWLMAYWSQQRRLQGTNLVQDAAWHTGCRGRGAMDFQWVFDIPELHQGYFIPVAVRILDPLNVGFAYGPFGVDYAFHKYQESRRYVRKAYPEFEFKESDRTVRDGEKNVDVISMWLAESDAVYHCVVIDKQFAKPVTKTKYPMIPMIEWMGDGAPVANEAARGLSILHGIKDTWPAKSRLLSKIATGLNFTFYPMYKAKTPSGVEWKQPLVIKPGAVLDLDAEQDVTPMQSEVNLPIANVMLQMLDTQIQQATFPTVMYGDNGGASSGYAINQLASSARGRINTIRMNLESAFERANQIILALVETFGDDEGVTLLAAGKEPGDRGAPITINADDIQGNYNNMVMLVPEIPTDETQRIMTWSGEVEKGHVSEQFLRDRIYNLPVPRDEGLRVAMEQAVKSSPELQQKMWLAAIREVYKDKDQWRRIIAGTPYEQLNQAEEQWIEQEKALKEQERVARAQAKEQKKQQEEEQKAMDYLLKNGEPPKGWHVMPDGTIMKDGAMGPQPTGLPPMMPPGSPLDLGAPPPSGLPMPMGNGGPLPIPGGMPGAVSGTLGASPSSAQPLPPPNMSPMPPGVPPEAGPGLTPEMMNVPPQGGMPGMYQQLQGQPLTDEEIARRLMGAIGNGPPPAQR